MTTTLKKKVIQNKSESVFHANIKHQERNGYVKASEVKLSSCGTWQVLMVKEIAWENKGYNPDKPKGWGKQERQF